MDRNYPAPTHKLMVALPAHLVTPRPVMPTKMAPRARRGALIAHHARPTPVWRGTMIAARRWGEFGAHSRELAPIRFETMDREAYGAIYFAIHSARRRRLGCYGGGSHIAVGQQFLDRVFGGGGRVWGPPLCLKGVHRSELGWEGSRCGQPVSPVDHDDPITTKNKTLEGFYTSLIQGDSLVYYGIGHAGRQDCMLLSVHSPPFSLNLQCILVLLCSEPLWTKAKTRYSDCGRSYVDDFTATSSLGRPATVAGFLRASQILDHLLFRYGLAHHPK